MLIHCLLCRSWNLDRAWYMLFFVQQITWLWTGGLSWCSNIMGISLVEKRSYPSNSQPQLLSTSSPSRGNFRNPLQKWCSLTYANYDHNVLSILPTDIFDICILIRIYNIYICFLFVYLYGVPLLRMFLKFCQTFHSTSFSTSEFDWALLQNIQDKRIIEVAVHIKVRYTVIWGDTQRCHIGVMKLQKICRIFVFIAYIYPVFPLDPNKELRHVSTSTYMFYLQLESR